MDNLGNLNSALGYIESRLDAEIHMQDLARIMCCSSYNVQRMFSFLAGIEIEAPLNEEGFQLPVKLWLDSFKNGEINKLCALPSGENISSRSHALSLYGIANHRQIDDEHFAYMIACPLRDEADGADYVTRTIPEHTYAILKSQPYSADDRLAMQKQVNEIQHRMA